MKNVFSVRTLLFLALFLIHQAVLAKCRHEPYWFESGWIDPITLTIPLSGDITVPRDAPVGTVIFKGSHQYAPADAKVARCDGGSVTHLLNAIGPLGFYGATTFRTNIPGVGFRMYIAGRYLPKSFDSVIAHNGYFYLKPPFNVVNYELVKMEARAISGTVIGAQLPAGSYTYKQSSDFQILSFTFGGAFTIRETSCSTPNVQVEMGEHQTSEFHGSGSRTALKAFSIALNNCPSGLHRITYQIEPTSKVLDAANGVVALDSGVGHAEGVGLQLLSSTGAPIMYSHPYEITRLSSAGGNFSIPLQAAYFQIRDSIGTGRANAAMMFTLTYE